MIGRPLTVSVVVPLYNGAAYVADLMQSIAAQDHRPIEVIVVNDGSSDGGELMIEAHAAGLPVRLLHQSNQGQSAARNAGVAVATGDCIAFIDQDDRWYPDHLTKLLEPFRSVPGLGWSYSDVDEIDVEGRLVTIGWVRKFGGRHPKDTLVNLLSEDMYILPSASLVLREAFLRCGGFDPRLSGYEDDDLFLRLFRAGWRHAYIPEPLSQWRIHAGSSSHSRRMTASRDIYAAKLIEAYPDEPLLGRFYKRDCIAPRFFRATLNEYLFALSTGDEVRCRSSLASLRRYADLRAYRAWPDLKRRIAFVLMRHPRLLRRILALRRILSSGPIGGRLL